MAAFLWTCVLLVCPLVIAQNTTEIRDVCHKEPRTCLDVPHTGSKYVLATMADGMTHVCDMETDNGGWSVFQRRVVGDVSFDRNFDEYKYGFGNYDEDFWWGLENLAEITSKGLYELYVSFDFNSKSYFARYEHFRLYKEKENYKLEVRGYSGTAGDSLSPQNGMQFTTKDRDNDPDTTRNCAVRFKGAWWHKTCHRSNLNGLWGSTDFGEGTNWFATSGHRASVTNIKMMVRLAVPIKHYTIYL